MKNPFKKNPVTATDSTTGMDSLTNLIAGLSAKGDKQTYATYLRAVQLRDETCGAMLRTSWAAGKMARIPAEDMTRAGWQVSTQELSADQVTTVERAANKLFLSGQIFDAITFGRCYGGAFLIIGKSNQADWDLELTESSFRQGDSMTLTLMDKTQLFPDISQIDLRPGSLTFGEPLRYRINNGSLLVHRSRMLAFIGKRIPYREYQRNGYWHDSVYQDTEDAIKRYDTVASVINSMLYESNVDVLAVDGLSAQLTTEVGTKQVQKRFSLVAQLKSVVNMLVIDTKDKFDKKPTSFAGVNDIFNSFKSDLSGATDIPITRFFGQSPAGMSSTGDGDYRNYVDSTKFKQGLELKPKLMLIYRILCICAFGKAPDDLDIAFNPIWQDKPADVAAAEANRAKAAETYTSMGAVQVSTVTSDLIARKVYVGIGADDEKMAKEADGINNDGRTIENSPVPTEPEAKNQNQAT